MRNILSVALVGLVGLVGCGGSKPAPVATKQVEEPPPVVAEPVKPAEPEPPPPPPAPTAELADTTLTLTFGGTTYALTNSFVQPLGKGKFELHFEQPMTEGYMQLWLMPKDVIKKGVAAKVEGNGMTAAFVQLPKGEKSADNVSSKCDSLGTVTFDAVPKAKRTVSGSVDVTVTCTDVPALNGPIAIQGTFTKLPVKK